MSEEEWEGVCDWCGESLSGGDYDGMCAACAYDFDDDEDVYE